MQGRGTLVGLDRDGEMIEHAKRRFREEGVPEGCVRWIVGSYGELTRLLAEAGIRTYDGILFDLGLNTLQLSDADRGFSFHADGPLDARFSREEPIPTLGERLARISQERLEQVLRDWGNERWARRIARAILRRREREPIRTTGDLAAIVRRAVPPVRGRRRIDAATRTFQALRMLVNEELEHLERGLEQAIAGLGPSGKIVVISFHSGEDRIVKTVFRRHDARRQGQGEDNGTTEGPRLEVLTRKPVRPGESECQSNPSARSARLRAAVRAA